MPSNIDSEIDRLYQLPAGEFTAARNALAKTAGKNAGDVRQLAKPSVAAWAVNQLYWKRRDDYDALVKAATDLRKIHKAILAGHRADIRDATKEHDASVDRALKSTLELLRDDGHLITDATRQAIQTTLRALPANEAPGRLTQALQPGGFEMLSGLSVAPAGHAARATTAQVGRPVTAHVGRPFTGRQAPAVTGRHPKNEKPDRKAQEAAAKAARELRLAEHEAQRQEFEAAKAAREAEKAARAVEAAREAVEAAQKELDEAERAAREAARARDAAQRKAESAAAAVARLKKNA
jgi:hypothetical protein